VVTVVERHTQARTKCYICNVKQDMRNIWHW